MLLHQSNRLENLFQQLAVILEEPPDDPLQPEIIVVQNQGMAQWVSRQLALQTGIAANLHFPLPGRCIWDLFDRLSGEDPGEDLFQTAILRWRIFTLLPGLLDQPAFAEPAAYLAQDPAQTQLYQLSAKISDAFDQYQVYRPDLLRNWQQGEENHWQAILWRCLSETTPSQRVELGRWWRQLLNGSAVETSRLPQRLHLFGLNSLAPVYLEIFAQAGALFPLHLYHLSPCWHYWGDLVSARQQAAMRARGREVGGDAYYDQGHPLLVSLGRTGQDFFRQLQECPLEDVDLYQPGEEHHLLSVIQNDILELRDRSVGGEEPYLVDPADHSIQLHCCYSPLREIQVLHDRLLDLFAALPDLTPGDILVSAPDIGRYAEAIKGVFGQALPEHRLPWSIADQSLASEQPQIRCFLDLLALLESRFSAPEVLALCENPLLLARFGLDAGQLPRLHTWVEAAGIRWGLDSEHRHQLEVEAGSVHSWRFGLDRLLLGYLMGEANQTFADLLPYAHLAAGEAEVLGGFVQLLDTLAHWQQEIRSERTPIRWCTDLRQMVDDFFADDLENPGINLLKETLVRLQADCRLADMQAPLAYAVLRVHLQECLAQTSGGQPFLSGRVTFCNMVPMRSVPFKVICLLGLGDQDFPRSQRPPSFDLMAAAPRLGDRNRRNDDRYLFLEALLSAREVLYLSWVGRSQRDESQVPPSVVVCELRDYIDQSCRLAENEESTVSEALTTEHPMQPFSRRCFDGHTATGSYNPAWIPAHQAGDPAPFLSAPLPGADNSRREVDLVQLVCFWRHPVRFFLEHSLGLRVRGEEGALAESEPFQLDQLQRYFLRSEVVSASLAGVPIDQQFDGLAGSGRLPQAGFGRVQFEQIEAEAGALAFQLQPLLSEPLEPLEIDHHIGPFHLTGWLHNLYPSGRVTWRPGRRKGADLMEWWLGHLCLNLLRPLGQGLSSIHLSCERQQKIQAVQHAMLHPVAGPEAILEHLLGLYWQGLSRPLPFFPDTSLAWAEAKPGMEADKARAVWAGGFQWEGEGSDPAYGYFYPAQALPLSEEFVDLTTLFAPILAHLEDGHATS
ncbi:MAG: exodeoxyribonuclease V subunit gamma [Desulfobulbus sp.]|nr:exodeoxyribonuclease V subunit gamma [Desulfobulbus sp.]